MQIYVHFILLEIPLPANLVTVLKTLLYPCRLRIVPIRPEWILGARPNGEKEAYLSENYELAHYDTFMFSRNAFYFHETLVILAIFLAVSWVAYSVYSCRRQKRSRQIIEKQMEERGIAENPAQNTKLTFWASVRLRFSENVKLRSALKNPSDHRLDHATRTVKQVMSQAPQRLYLLGSLEIFLCTLIYAQQTDSQKELVSRGEHGLSIFLIVVSFIVLAAIYGVMTAIKYFHVKGTLASKDAFRTYFGGLYIDQKQK